MSNILNLSNLTSDSEDITRRLLFLHDVVDAVSTNALMTEIQTINAEDEQLEKELAYKYNIKNYERSPIILDINTNGGLVHDGLALIATMEQSKTPIITKVNGYAFSMGVLIFLAGKERYMSRHASLMYHQILTEVFGRLRDIEEDMAVNKDLQKRLEKYVLERTKMNLDDLRKIYRQKRDVYIYSDEALKLGFATKII